VKVIWILNIDERKENSGRLFGSNNLIERKISREGNEVENETFTYLESNVTYDLGCESTSNFNGSGKVMEEQISQLTN